MKGFEFLRGDSSRQSERESFKGALALNARVKWLW